MNRDQADKLIAAMNTIESLRQEQHNEHLTETQVKTQLALADLLKEEGFEFTHTFPDDTGVCHYSITAQTAYNWNW